MPEEKPSRNRTSPSAVQAALPEMVRMYEVGLPILAIAAQFGFAVETVRKRLIDAGMKMRPIGRTNASQSPPRSNRKSHRERKNPLSQEEVDRLRKLIGFRPEES